MPTLVFQGTRDASVDPDIVRQWCADPAVDRSSPARRRAPAHRVDGRNLGRRARGFSACRRNHPCIARTAACPRRPRTSRIFSPAATRPRLICWLWRASWPSPVFEDPLVDVLRERGIAHEKAYVDVAARVRSDRRRSQRRAGRCRVAARHRHAGWVPTSSCRRRCAPAAGSATRTCSGNSRARARVSARGRMRRSTPSCRGKPRAARFCSSASTATSSPNCRSTTPEAFAVVTPLARNGIGSMTSPRSTAG